MADKGILSHYSPEDVTISIAGLMNIEGYAEGSFVSITRDAPLFETVESADGRISRVKRPSKTHTVEITLMGTAESNELLTRLSLIDHNTLVAKFPLMIKDNLGGTVFFSASAWVESLPVTQFSTTVTDRTWRLKCAQATLFVGGNEDQSSTMEDVINVLSGLAPSVRQFL